MSWTATIVKHNDDNLTMEVRYERAGYEPVTVGVLLPPEGEDLQAHLQAYAPTLAWEMEDEKKIKRQRPAVGTTVTPPAGQAQSAEPAPPVVVLGTIEVQL